MNHLPKVPLTDLILEAQSGFASGRKDDDGVAQIRMNNVTTGGQLDFSSIRRVPIDASKNMRRFFLNEGDILFNSTNSPQLVGKTALFKVQDEPFVFSNHFVRIVVDPKRLNSGYLARWLTLQQQRGYFASVCTQWVNQASVRKEDLLSLEVPLPPLGEQKRIARILDVAAAVQAQRCATLTQLDALLQSTFIHMFGDPVTNPMRWERKRLDQLGEIVTGNTPSRQVEDYYGSFIEWIKSDNINTPFHYLTRATEYLSEPGKRVGRVAPKNSILVTCIAGSPDCIGNAAIADRQVAFNQQINALIPFNKQIVFFLYVQFLLGKRLVQSSSTNSMKGMVSKSAFSTVEFIAPPEDLQLEFSKRALKIQKVAEHHQRSAVQFDMLFQSLQQRAFRGELSPSP